MFKVLKRAAMWELSRNVRTNFHNLVNYSPRCKSVPRKGDLAKPYFICDSNSQTHSGFVSSQKEYPRILPKSSRGNIAGSEIGLLLRKMAVSETFAMNTMISKSNVRSEVDQDVKWFDVLEVSNSGF